MPMTKDFTHAPGYLAFSYLVQKGIPGSLTEAELRTLQLDRLNQTLQLVRSASRYYAAHLPTGKLNSLEQLGELPLMDSSVLSNNYDDLLCVSQSDISRIVTLPTSGTSGAPKRMAFSPEDQQETVSYFEAGMRMLVEADEAIAVLYPCDKSGGLGALLCESVARVPARAVPYGVPRSFTDLADCFRRENIRGLIGFPQHVFAFARWCEHNKVELDIRGVLLSADTIAASLQNEIARIWGAEVFAHFGMTETGYGGAVECGYHRGHHIRETDLLFEIIDPLTREVLPDEEWGELVFTTINAHALPLIRYRTGDCTRLIAGACPCGSILKRMDVVKGRVQEYARIGDSAFGMPELEEILFAIPGVIDFEACFEADSRGASEGASEGASGVASEGAFEASPAQLSLSLAVLPGATVDALRVQAALMASEVFASLIDNDSLLVQIAIETTDDFNPYYQGKRSLLSR
jgi:phenylacetate-coenzyme A ligase PaaK-like adenylate-forming protein